jgi:hypothetical protein
MTLVWKPTLNEVTRHEPHKGDKRQIRRERALLKSRWKSLAADRRSHSKTMSWASGMSSSNS